MRKGIIYMATSPSGKSYIGQTIRTLKNRKKGHKNGSGKYNFAFPRAIRKYGINNFEWKILYDNVPEINLNLMEIWAIAKYETFVGYGKGYNSTLGGGDNPMNYKEFREKVSKANKGKTRKGTPKTEEEKKRMSERMKGRKPEDHPMYGKHHSEETKRRLSENHIGKQVGADNPFFGEKHTEETKKKMSENHKDVSGENNPFFGKEHSEETKKKMRKPRKKMRKQKLLSFDEMREIRKKYETGKFSYYRLAKEYDVSRGQIYNVIECRTERSRCSLVQETSNK